MSGVYGCCDFKGIGMIVLNRNYVFILGLVFKVVIFRSLYVCFNNIVFFLLYFKLFLENYVSDK